MTPFFPIPEYRGVERGGEALLARQAIIAQATLHAAADDADADHHDGRIISSSSDEQRQQQEEAERNAVPLTLEHGVLPLSSAIAVAVAADPATLARRPHGRAREPPRRIGRPIFDSRTARRLVGRLDPVAALDRNIAAAVAAAAATTATAATGGAAARAAIARQVEACCAHLDRASLPFLVGGTAGEPLEAPLLMPQPAWCMAAPEPALLGFDAACGAGGGLRAPMRLEAEAVELASVVEGLLVREADCVFF